MPPAQSVPAKTPAPRRGKRRERNQAIAIQRILTATILDPETPAQSRASCAAAWSRVAEIKRILDGRPLPGQLRPDLLQAAQAHAKRLGPPARLKIVAAKVAPIVRDQSMLNDSAATGATGA
jgi:hypothetical protein